MRDDVCLFAQRVPIRYNLIMELYIVRHGQTDWNADGLLQGRSDTRLNQNGIDAAKTLGAKLRGVRFDKIFCSPLQRAFQTACLIRGELGAREEIPIIKDERLIEISFGEGEGKHYTEWMNENSPYRYFFTAPEKYPTPPGGESFESVCVRTRDFVQTEIEAAFCEGARDARFMVVAHGALNKGMMCYIQKHGVKDYWLGDLQKNCQASVFDYDGKEWRQVIR